MIQKYIIKGLVVALICCSVLAVHSCSEEDGYKKYTDAGEILYTGKMDSVKVFSGANRVKLVGQLSADPKVTSYRIFWNNKMDSINIAVDASNSGSQVERLIEGLEENIYNFEIRTFDIKGNSSIPVFITGRVYGERFRSSLNNRPILRSKFTEGTVRTEFVDIDLTDGAFATEIEYPTNDGEIAMVNTPIDSSEVLLEEYKVGVPFRYRTLFKPDSLSIDVFKTDYDTITPIFPILKNNEKPFAISDLSGKRYSTAAEWKHNAGALSHHGGVYGMVDKNGGNSMNVVSGYGGEPDLVNAKMYQTVDLEPGKYTYTVMTGGGNWNLEDQQYFLVAKGSDLPDVVDVETSSETLIFARVTNDIGKPMGFKYTLTFEVAEQTEVSVGLAVTNVPGASKYMELFSFNLEKEE